MAKLFQSSCSLIRLPYFDFLIFNLFGSWFLRKILREVIEKKNQQH